MFIPIVTRAYKVQSWIRRSGTREKSTELRESSVQSLANAIDADPTMFEKWNRELPELVRQNPVVRIPSHVVLMGRALGLLSGVSRSLGGKIDLVRAVLPYVMGATPTRAS